MHKILAKAESLAKADGRVLNVHFLYGEMLALYYKDRENPESLEAAIAACRQQIALADQAAQAFRSEFKDEHLPAHKGYQQLAIILEKRKQFDEAIELCSQAQTQGWAGDWQKRIDRLKKKTGAQPSRNQ